MLFSPCIRLLEAHSTPAILSFSSVWILSTGEGRNCSLAWGCVEILSKELTSKHFSKAKQNLTCGHTGRCFLCTSRSRKETLVGAWFFSFHLTGGSLLRTDESGAVPFVQQCSFKGMSNPAATSEMWACPCLLLNAVTSSCESGSRFWFVGFFS